VPVIALDAMGGDHAPGVTAAGALRAAAAGVEVALVGDQAEVAVALDRALAAAGQREDELRAARAQLRIVHAPDRIGMGEHVAREVRSRRESSIYVGTELVKRGEADAFVSAGNTGAVLATALVVLGRIAGVQRPALGAVLPAASGPRLLVDAGANAESRASHLVQFALLGDAYVRAALGVERPRVALLSIGEEGSKGSPAIVEAHVALADSPLHFVGNVEGRDLTATNVADVIVADGFSGNVALKSIEGVVTMLWEELATVAHSSWRGRLGGWLLMPGLRATRDRMDYRRYGGAPLLGVDGLVYVGHGRSDARAIESALLTAAEGARAGVLAALAAAVGATGAS
jgi:glycerol-3-phosphate acyltransferase PlsX